MKEEINLYINKLSAEEKLICNKLLAIINAELKGSIYKMWHGHPVWFINENPIVGFSKQKAGIRLMFWSGADFGEETLNILGKKFKDASIFYSNLAELNDENLKRYLMKSIKIQWDYKNIVKRKGKLEIIK